MKPDAKLNKVNNEWAEKDNTTLTTNAPVPSDWWKGFNDPALDKLIDLAYKQNLSLQIAGLRILQARAQLGYATGQKYPQVQVATGTATAVGISKNSASYIPGFDTRICQLPTRVRCELGDGFLGQVPAWRGIRNRGARRLGRRLRQCTGGTHRGGGTHLRNSAHL